VGPYPSCTYLDYGGQLVSILYIATTFQPSDDYITEVIMPEPTSGNLEDSIEAPKPKLKFSPAVVGEYILDVEERLALLRDLLSQERWAFQRTNINKAIEMYESGAWPLPRCQEVWLNNGEVIDGLPQKINKGDCFWSEGLAYQLGQGVTTPLVSTPPTTAPAVGSRDGTINYKSPKPNTLGRKQ
jgi:hypothetical protein